MEIQYTFFLICTIMRHVVLVTLWWRIRLTLASHKDIAETADHAVVGRRWGIKRFTLMSHLRRAVEGMDNTGAYIRIYLLYLLKQRPGGIRHPGDKCCCATGQRSC